MRTIDIRSLAMDATVASGHHTPIGHFDAVGYWFHSTIHHCHIDETRVIAAGCNDGVRGNVGGFALLLVRPVNVVFRASLDANHLRVWGEHCGNPRLV